MEDGGGKTAGCFWGDEKILRKGFSALFIFVLVARSSFQFFVTFFRTHTQTHKQTHTHTRHATPRNDDDDGDNIGIDDVIIVEDVREEDDEYHQRAPKRNDCFRS